MSVNGKVITGLSCMFGLLLGILIYRVSLPETRETGSRSSSSFQSTFQLLSSGAPPRNSVPHLEPGRETSSLPVGNPPAVLEQSSKPLYLDLTRPLKPQLVKLFSQDMAGLPLGLLREIRENLAVCGPLVLEIVKDKDLPKSVRNAAIYALCHFEVPGTKEVLFGLATSSECAELKWSLVYTLGRRGDPGTAAVLTRMVLDSDGLAMRKHVIEALGYAGDLEARPAVQSILRSSQIIWESLSAVVQRVNVQLDAAAARDPVSATVPLLHSDDPEMREWAIVYLTRLNPPGRTQYLRAAADSIKVWTEGKRRVHARIECALLAALKESGGHLTSLEEQFVDAVSSNQPYQLPK